MTIKGYTGFSGNSTSITKSYALPSGTTFLLVTGVNSENGGLSSITWNGKALNFYQNNTRNFVAWLKNPDVGTYNLVLSKGGDTMRIGGTIIALDGVNGTDPFAQYQETAHYDATNPISNTFTTLFNSSYLFEFIFCNDNALGNSYTAGAGETETADFEFYTHNHNYQSAYKPAATIGSYTMTETNSSSNINQTRMWMLELKDASTEISAFTPKVMIF
ncbi:MAG: hypothetical protein IPM48_14560 [Saprospiraceae bacterium]|nr:hypothetical protein [Saprospiraceae bacterium]